MRHHPDEDALERVTTRLAYWQARPDSRQRRVALRYYAQSQANLKLGMTTSPGHAPRTTGPLTIFELLLRR